MDESRYPEPPDQDPNTPLPGQPAESGRDASGDVKSPASLPGANADTPQYEGASWPGGDAAPGEPGNTSRAMQAEAGAAAAGVSNPAPSAQPAEFASLSPDEPSTNPSANIELLLDVNLPVSIELGRTRMSISDILELGSGSIVELDKLAGEPVDILVNNKPLAKGEVVVLDENFGVRITSLVSPRERLDQLNLS